MSCMRDSWPMSRLGCISFTVGCERSETVLQRVSVDVTVVLTARQHHVRTRVWLVGNHRL
jgi:hypothetical protein